MNKVIFLDIDGVLSFDFMTFDNSCVENLKLIIQYTNANICLSSFWRLNFFRKRDVKTMIEDIGGKYIGETIEYDGKNRFDEIWDFVEKTKPDNWIILDDYSPFSITPEIDEDKIRIVEKVWIETYFNIGLTKENARDAISILNNDKNFVFPEMEIFPNFFLKIETEL